MIQIYFIPFAGGNASYFDKLISRLNSSFAIYKYEYPGHGIRNKEKLVSDYKLVSKDIFNFIKSNRILGIEYFIFAFSMGTIFAYDVVKNYLQDDMPNRVFICSHRPPNYHDFYKNPFEMDDEEFYYLIEPLEGINKNIYNNKIYKRVYLPILKNDYYLLYRYKEYDITNVFKCDLYLLGSKSDPEYKYMKYWKVFTKNRIFHYNFDGGHFFLNNNIDKVALIINNIGGNYE